MERAFFQNENISIQIEWNIKQGIKYKLESLSCSTGSSGPLNTFEIFFSLKILYFEIPYLYMCIILLSSTQNNQISKLIIDKCNLD